MRRVIEKDRKQPVPDKEPSGRLQDMGVSWPCSDVSPPEAPLVLKGTSLLDASRGLRRAFFILSWNREVHDGHHHLG